MKAGDELCLIGTAGAGLRTAPTTEQPFGELAGGLPHGCRCGFATEKTRENEKKDGQSGGHPLIRFLY